MMLVFIIIIASKASSIIEGEHTQSLNLNIGVWFEDTVYTSWKDTS